MLPIDGTWFASYSAGSSPVGNPSPDETALLVFKDGQITGTDPHGGMYVGTYTLKGEDFVAELRVTAYDSDAITVFEGVAFPLIIATKGQFRSPDYFSGTGMVNGEHQIIFNCRRKTD